MSKHLDRLRAFKFYWDRNQAGIQTEELSDAMLLLADYEALEQRLAEAEKDAGRYRWLRVAHNSDPRGVRTIMRANVIGFDFDKSQWRDLYGTDLDDAIDAARGKP